MARGKKAEAQAEARIIEAEERGKTARTVARWDGLKRIVPAFFGAASPVALAIVQAQTDGPDVVNIVLLVLLIVVVPSALAKIVYDGLQKKRLRERTTALEQENRELTNEVAELRRALPAPGSP